MLTYAAQYYVTVKHEMVSRLLVTVIVACALCLDADLNHAPKA